MTIAARMNDVRLDVNSYCLFSYYINDLFLVLSLQPSVTRYDFVFKGIRPLKDSVREYIFHVRMLNVCVCVCSAYTHVYMHLLYMCTCLCACHWSAYTYMCMCTLVYVLTYRVYSQHVLFDSFLFVSTVTDSVLYEGGLPGTFFPFQEEGVHPWCSGAST